MLWQAIINGITVGSLYALLALGLVLIFKTTTVLNFAHGEMAMITTFGGLWLMSNMGLPYWVAIIGALAFGAFIGLVTERIVRPLLDAPILSHNYNKPKLLIKIIRHNICALK
jgi:branched-subunit amino acid ABC-type transport system permease component